MLYILATFTLSYKALHIVKSAIRARRSVFDNIAAHFSSPAAGTSLGSSPLDRSAICIDISLAFGGAWLGIIAWRWRIVEIHDGGN